MLEKIQSELKISNKKIAYLGIYLSFILVLTFVPYTGYMVFGPIAITIIPIFVALGAWTLGFWGALVSSLGFGLGSYFMALAGLAGPTGVVFLANPEVIIVPRLLMGMAIFAIVKFMGNVSPVKFIITTTLAFALNTIFFLIVNEIVNTYSTALPAYTILLPLIYANVIVELSISPFLGYLMYRAAKQAMNQISDDNAW